MKYHNKKKYPILLFLFIFCLDKIFLIPFVQKHFTQASPIPFFEPIAENQFPKEDKLKWAIQNRKKIIFAFGSSTFYGFYFTDSKSYSKILNKTLPTHFQNKIENLAIFNFSYAGATVISHLIRIEQLLERGYKPNLIIMELAPSSFNSESSFYNAEISESITLKFIQKNFYWIPKVHIQKNLLQRIFLLSKLKLGFSGQDELQIMKQYRNVMTLGAKQEELPLSFEAGEEKLGFHLSNQYMIQSFRETFNNYKPSSEMILYFQKIIELTNKNQIPIIFIHTAVHPLVNEVIKETSISTEWKIFLEKENLQNYHDLNSNQFCTNFMDPLHMGISCYIKLYPIILNGMSRNQPTPQIQKL